MTENNKLINLGNLVRTGTCGVSIAGNKSAIGFDFSDSRVSIEMCSDDTYVVWFHTPDGYSIRVLADTTWMRDIGNAFIKVTDVFGGAYFDEE